MSKLQKIWTRRVAVYFAGMIVGWLLALPVTDQSWEGIIVVSVTLIATAAIQLAIEYHFELDRITTQNRSRIADLIADELPRSIPEHIESLCKQHVDSLINATKSILKESTALIPGGGAFEEFYKNALANSGKSHILATALADPDYFFDNEFHEGSVEAAIRDFIGAGGRMTRTFIVPSNQTEDPEHSFELRDLLTVQQKIGVRAFSIDSNALSTKGLHARFILMPTSCRFAWEVFARHDGSIESIRVTSRRQFLEQACIYFNTLRDLVGESDEKVWPVVALPSA
jgi:hypothetical protein